MSFELSHKVRSEILFLLEVDLKGHKVIFLVLVEGLKCCY